MNAHKVPNVKLAIRLPRRIALIGAFVAAITVLPLVVGVLPWVISLLTPRYGWANEAPGIWNFVGLLPVIVGAVAILWCYGVHMAAYPRQIELALAPPYLLTHGPYKFSRNPMYMGTMAMWLGWTIFYGSISVLIWAVLWAVVYGFIIVPREERALKTQFGDVYLQYKGKTPRWLGNIRP